MQLYQGEKGPYGSVMQNFWSCIFVLEQAQIVPKLCSMDMQMVTLYR